MSREIGPTVFYSPEGGYGYGYCAEKSRPVRRNLALRGLYNKLQEKLSTDFDQAVIENAAELARKRIYFLQVPLDIEESMRVQQYLFINIAQFESTREILSLMKEEVDTSEASLYYKQHILNNLVTEINHSPQHFRNYPIDIDDPQFRFKWGIGSEGETGIFAKDTAFQLEVSAYKDELIAVGLVYRPEHVITAYGKERVNRAYLSEWKAAMEAHYRFI